MPKVLRKVDRKILWSTEPLEDEETWHSASELRADALVDLRTNKNALSIFVVDDVAGVPVDRIVAALAANRSFLDHVDYIAVDMRVILDLGIKIDNAPGATCDSGVDQCHRNLINLTARKVAELGNSLQKVGEVKRIQVVQVGRLINAGLKAGHIVQNKVNPEILNKLKDARYSAPAAQG
jgi:hypothetical protein